MVNPFNQHFGEAMDAFINRTRFVIISDIDMHFDMPLGSYENWHSYNIWIKTVEHTVDNLKNAAVICNLNMEHNLSYLANAPVSKFQSNGQGLVAHVSNINNQDMFFDSLLAASGSGLLSIMLNRSRAEELHKAMIVEAQPYLIKNIKRMLEPRSVKISDKDISTNFRRNFKRNPKQRW